ncbi:prolyl oligopeptidase family serine peptidase [Streptomyces sp. NPDC050504]|uniref:prolyl oligopeptidase family serine peptidase n=1 Tax=Streptomyces sp. NPDC050504 TaxID=3365618 RepID=UPI0037AFB745
MTVNPDAFPTQFARTRRFTLGVPGQFVVSPDGDRVLFTRTDSGTDATSRIWLYDVPQGSARDLSGPGAGAFATDRQGRLVAFVRDGELWTVRTDGSAPRRIPTPDAPGPVTAPRPSPDGSLVAYVSGGALRVVRTDGTHDRVLARPSGADVTYGLPDHTATESIGRSRAYWWSPGSDALLVARVDTSMVRRRYIADPAHPEQAPREIRYPAAGTANAVTTLHLVTVDGLHTDVRIPPRAPEPDAPLRAPEADIAPTVWRDPAFEYVLSADWGAMGPVATVQTRDQRTVWTVLIDPASGEVGVLDRQTDEHWVELPKSTPLFTSSGLPVLPAVDGDVRTIRIGGVPAPAGLHVREVLGAAGEHGDRVLFTATDEDPTQTHVWSYEPGRGHERLSDGPGVHTAAAGGDTVVLDSRTADGQHVTVLRGEKPVGRIEVLAEEPLIRPRPVHLTLGRRELRSRLHLPSWYGRGDEGPAPLPVLLSPYAGPGMQVVTRARAWYTAVCQWFAEQGFAVLSTDGRGTPGRGMAWDRAILGDRLGPVLTDQVDALHAAAERYPALDLDRVAIRGWSFSGYLAAGAVLHRPDVFHAAVAGAAPTDRRLYDTYWEERHLGHPDVQPDGYERSDLLPHAARLSRPLLLVHGLADDNVAPANTLRLSAALLAAGRPHSLLTLPGTGHLVAREGVADGLLRVELDFLKKSLGI